MYISIVLTLCYFCVFIYFLIHFHYVFLNLAGDDVNYSYVGVHVICVIFVHQYQADIKLFAVDKKCQNYSFQVPYIKTI